MKGQTVQVGDKFYTHKDGQFTEISKPSYVRPEMQQGMLSQGQAKQSKPCPTCGQPLPSGNSNDFYGIGDKPFPSANSNDFYPRSAKF